MSESRKYLRACSKQKLRKEVATLRKLILEGDLLLFGLTARKITDKM